MILGRLDLAPRPRVAARRSLLLERTLSKRAAASRVARVLPPRLLRLSEEQTPSRRELVKMGSRPITVSREDNRWNVVYGDGTVERFKVRDEALEVADIVAWREGRDIDITSRRPKPKR